ncbi:hypothetical protein R3P38DRAFT_317901 [Favolaschia claudopus]|uniref:Uncharacterized protein n=1 Tax=Favolaschia claudopus TaxID=2862362 RepID=A0AAW0CU01_9AGAR
MHFSILPLVVAATVYTAVFAAPTPSRREVGINCPSVDDDTSPLLGSGADQAQSLALCYYQEARNCKYFTDGSFSSGSSVCPDGLPQDPELFTGGSSDSTSSDSDSTSSNGEIGISFFDGVTCASTDEAGSELTAAKFVADNSGNEFAQCTYETAGVCAFFFADGSFSSGSSECPEGVPQTPAVAQQNDDDDSIIITTSASRLSSTSKKHNHNH